MLAVASAAHYRPENYGGGFNHGFDGYSGASSGYSRGPQIPILSYENVNNGDGNYRYRYNSSFIFLYFILKMEYHSLKELAARF